MRLKDPGIRVLLRRWQSGWRIWRVHGLPDPPRRDEDAEPEKHGCRAESVR